ncbi:hypothetical protein [Bradyrhizobium septentrionale]|uniref:hypothetical protein n=1 Tax=Bradyrhizobium septentrionale TaxID=1404411 RepID=UPI003B8A8EC3
MSKGDVFFEEDALRYLMMSQATDVAAVAPFNESMEGSAVLLSDSGVITSFRMKQTAANLRGWPKTFQDDEPATIVSDDAESNDRPSAR